MSCGPADLIESVDATTPSCRNAESPAAPLSGAVLCGAVLVVGPRCAARGWCVAVGREGLRRGQAATHMLLAWLAAHFLPSNSTSGWGEPLAKMARPCGD
jgi:hypothetical protein